MGNKSDKQTQAYLTVFNQQSEELRFIKTLQWKVTYYIVFAYTAVISIVLNFFSKYIIVAGIIAILLIIFIVCLGLLHLFRQLDNIERKRNILKSIIEHDEYLKKVYEIEYFRKNGNDEENADEPILIMLKTGVLLGGLISILILLFKICSISKCCIINI
jgi:uncharacterized membrane-anchored protein